MKIQIFTKILKYPICVCSFICVCVAKIQIIFVSLIETQKKCRFSKKTTTPVGMVEKNETKKKSKQDY